MNAELLAIDRECRIAIEELREAARPHGLILENAEPGDDGWLTIYLGGDIDRHRMMLHFAGALVKPGPDRHYEGTIEGHVAFATYVLRKLTSEFRKINNAD